MKTVREILVLDIRDLLQPFSRRLLEKDPCRGFESLVKRSVIFVACPASVCLFSCDPGSLEPTLPGGSSTPTQTWLFSFAGQKMSSWLAPQALPKQSGVVL